MHIDKVIFSTKVVYNNMVAPAAIAIEKGKIVGIANSLDHFNCDNVIDYKDLVILPGLIDSHFHIYESKTITDRDDWVSGSKAAANGGYTTVIEMPLSDPATDSANRLQKKKDSADKHSVIDFALWAGFTKESFGNTAELIEKGAISFKAFSCYCGENYSFLNDYEMLKAMEAVSSFGGFMCVHCENDEITKGLTNELLSIGETKGMAHCKSRPEIAEIEAISRMILFAEHTNCKLLIPHLSTPHALDIIQSAKSRNVQVFTETCPHYLTNSDHKLDELAADAKCNPPLRSKNCVESLWDAVKNGAIDIISSDHSPTSTQEKESFNENILKSPPGLSGVELVLPLMLTHGVNERDISFTKLAQLTSENPAKIHNIYPQKGTISIGSDADFTIIDPNEEWFFKKSFSKIPPTICGNKKLKGRVKHTIVRGKTVYENGEIKASEGYGNYIFRTPISQNK